MIIILVKYSVYVINLTISINLFNFTSSTILLFDFKDVSYDRNIKDKVIREFFNDIEKS